MIDHTCNNNAKLYEVLGLKFIYRSRKNDTHGGVAMYVSNKIQFDHRKDLEENMLGCIWIEIYVKKVRKLSHWNYLSTP